MDSLPSRFDPGSGYVEEKVSMLSPFFYIYSREWLLKLVKESVYLNLFTIVVRSDHSNEKLNLSSYIRQKNETRNGTLKSTMNP